MNDSVVVVASHDNDNDVMLMMMFMMLMMTIVFSILIFNSHRPYCCSKIEKNRRYKQCCLLL